MGLAHCMQSLCVHEAAGLPLADRPVCVALPLQVSGRGGARHFCQPCARALHVCLCCFSPLIRVILVVSPLWRGFDLIVRAGWNQLQLIPSPRFLLCRSVFGCRALRMRAAVVCHYPEPQRVPRAQRRCHSLGLSLTVSAMAFTGSPRLPVGTKPNLDISGSVV